MILNINLKSPILNLIALTQIGNDIEAHLREFDNQCQDSIKYLTDDDNNIRFCLSDEGERGTAYYLDDKGPVEWNYNDPCATWENHIAMRDYAKSTLEKERPEMYASLLKKLEALYKADRNK